MKYKGEAQWLWPVYSRNEPQVFDVMELIHIELFYYMEKVVFFLICGGFILFRRNKRHYDTLQKRKWCCCAFLQSI